MTSKEEVLDGLLHELAIIRCEANDVSFGSVVDVDFSAERILDACRNLERKLNALLEDAR